MSRKVGLVITVVGFCLGMILVVTHFTPKSKEIFKEQQSVSETVSEQGVASAWQQFYNLEFTGTGIVPTGMAFDGKSKVAFLDVTAQKLVVLEQKQKSFQNFVLPDGVMTTAVAYHADELYLYAGAIFVYQKSGQIWKKLTSEINFSPSPTHLVNFGGNFYLFGQNLIQRLNFDAQGNYLGIEEWLKEEGKIEPVDVYLDGYIYVSDKSGGVTRYLRGQAEKWWRQNELDGQIYLTGTDKQLFYLVSAEAKIYQFAKDGTLEREFSDELLQGGRFLWYLSESNTFFTLVDGVIYSFTPDDSWDEND